MGENSFASESRLEKSYAFWGFRGCVVPGCARKPRLHHIVPRREGGGNKQDNLLPICAFHEEGLHRAGAFARCTANGVPYGRKNRSRRKALARTTAQRKEDDVLARLAAKSHVALAENDEQLQARVKASVQANYNRYVGKKTRYVWENGVLMAVNPTTGEPYYVPGRIQYPGKALATNLAAPFLARLRKEVERDRRADAEAGPWRAIEPYAPGSQWPHIERAIATFAARNPVVNHPA